MLLENGFLAKVCDINDVFSACMKCSAGDFYVGKYMKIN